MAYTVQIEGIYGEETKYDRNGDEYSAIPDDVPGILYFATFSDESDAREALKRFLEDRENIVRLSERFKPLYLNASVLERSDLGQKWEVIYSESFLV